MNTIRNRKGTCEALPVPAAYMSYSHHDDDHENGRITAIGRILKEEVKMQTGQEFLLFQDRKDILWGQNWQERLEEGIDNASFLIPFITPRYLNSEWCNRELTLFTYREKRLKRNDLILPVYYIECPQFAPNSEGRFANKQHRIMISHQYEDWREKRFLDVNDMEFRKEIGHLAIQIRNSFYGRPVIK